MDNSGNLLNVEILDPSVDNLEAKFYFGFDGDSTGRYLGIAFGELLEDEEEVLRRSKSISNSIKQIKKIIYNKIKDSKSIIFAEGDNVLFKAKYNRDLLRMIQDKYTEITGLSSSIGFGKSLKEATIALRLAKARKGNSLVGVALKEEV